jgi:protein TIF31
MKASQMLTKEVIPRLVQLLDKLTIVPVDSPTLSNIFHENGVNLRFLGKLATTCLLPHLKEIAIVEMIARTSKKILNHHWVEFSKYEFREDNIDFLRKYSET